MLLASTWSFFLLNVQNEQTTLQARIVSKGFPRNAHFLSAMFGRIVRNSTMEDSIMQTSAGVTRTKQCVPSSYHFIFEMIIISIDALRSSFSRRVLMTLKRAQHDSPSRTPKRRNPPAERILRNLRRALRRPPQAEVENRTTRLLNGERTFSFHLFFIMYSWPLIIFLQQQQQQPLLQPPTT